MKRAMFAGAISLSAALSRSSLSHEQGGGDHGGEHIASANDPAIAVAGLIGFGIIAAFHPATGVPALQFPPGCRGDRADGSAVAVTELIFHGEVLSL
jgi:hypothetical protein